MSHVRGPPSRAVMLGEINRLMAQGDGSHSVEPHAVLPPLTSPLRAIQQEIASLPAVKIGVERAGWYRLTQPQLISAGLATAINPRMLQLFVDGEQVPIFVSGELDGKFDAGDTVEFYGLGLDTPSTSERTYWLIEGREPGTENSEGFRERWGRPSSELSRTLLNVTNAEFTSQTS